MLTNLLAQLILFAVPQAIEAPVVPTVAWEDLVEIPDGHLGEAVQLHVQAQSHPQTWDPFLTRFSPGEYVALRAWSDGQLPWVKADYDNPRVIVFARKGTAAARRLLAAEPHQRLVLGCIPREFQAGMTWVEVVGAHPTRAQLNEGSVLHVEKALDLFERDAPALAREQLVRALAAPLPKHARMAVEVLLASCDLRIESVRATRATLKR